MSRQQHSSRRTRDFTPTPPERDHLDRYVGQRCSRCKDFGHRSTRCPLLEIDPVHKMIPTLEDDVDFRSRPSAYQRRRDEAAERAAHIDYLNDNEIKSRLLANHYRMRDVVKTSQPDGVAQGKDLENEVAVLESRPKARRRRIPRRERTILDKYYDTSMDAHVDDGVQQSSISRGKQREREPEPEPDPYREQGREPEQEFEFMLEHEPVPIVKDEDYYRYNDYSFPKPGQFVPKGKSPPDWQLG